MGLCIGLGFRNRLGLNDAASAAVEDVTKVPIDKITSFLNDFVTVGGNITSSLFLVCRGDKYFTTGQTSAFGNDIIEKNWTLISKNVMLFNGKGNCFVDMENNLWMSGDSRCCGLGERSREFENLPRYEKCSDENILGKVKECWSNGVVTYVLLKDGQLWGTGLQMSDAGNKQLPGWSSFEDEVKFTKVLDNVDFFSMPNSDSDSNYRIAINSSGEFFGWGVSCGGANGLSGDTSYNVPTKYSVDSVTVGAEVEFLNSLSNMRVSFLTETGHVYYSGTHANDWDGGRVSTNGFSEYMLNLNSGEKVISVVSSCWRSAMFLTNKGRIFGYGPANRIGIGISTSEDVELRLINQLEDKNIVDIVAGNGYYIAISEDGKVYGTGVNSYGTLGRWLNADRMSPNSRYKTAFEWVECPELEI